MKSRFLSKPIFFVLLVFAVIALAACELRADRSDPIQLDAPSQLDPAVIDPNAAPTVDPNALPAATATAPEPGVTPGAGGEQPAAGGEGTTGETGEQPAGGGEGTTGEQSGTGEEAAQPRQTETYVVVSGDTLGQIAQRFDVAIEEIAAANNLVDIDTLDVGQELIIPGEDFVAPEPTAPPEGQTTTEAPAATGEQEHVVLAGQTLYSIGLRYGFTVQELQTYNNLPNPNVLEVGQIIKIPPAE